MPGKVNPVIPEVVNGVAFQVIGNDFTETMAAERGQQLLLNVIEVAQYLARALFDEAGRLDLVPVTSGSRIPFLYSEWSKRPCQRSWELKSCDTLLPI